MRPRRTGRSSTSGEEQRDGAPRRQLPAIVTQNRLTSSQIDKRQRKSRRIARKVGGVVESGILEHGNSEDEEDLVPPSDVEEYEDWKVQRAKAVSSEESSTAQSGRRRLSSVSNDHEPIARIGEKSPLHGSLSRTPTTQQLTYSMTPDTSQTIPLSSSQGHEEERDVDRDKERSGGSEELEGSLEEEGQARGKGGWTKFFSSPSASPSVSSSSSTQPSVSNINIPNNSTTSPSPSGSSSPRQEADRSLLETPLPHYSPISPTRPTGVSFQSPARSTASYYGKAKNSPKYRSDPITPTPASQSPLLTPYKHSASASGQQSHSPLIEAQLGSHNVPGWRKRPEISPSKVTETPLVAKNYKMEEDDELLLISQSENASAAPLGLSTLHPIATSTKTPVRPLSAAPLFHPSISLRETIFQNGLSHQVDLASQISDTTPRRPSFHNSPSPSPGLSLDHSRDSPSSHPDAHADHPVDPLPPPADPALERFRTARTFRTRTVLQLQPYTKERQIYEAALRRGGLKKGKKAVASAREITPNEEDNGSEGVDDGSEAMDEDPERIVIGSPSLAPQRHIPKPKELKDVDFDEYFLQYGAPADVENPIAANRLQAIARSRSKAEKEERKKRREEERQKREFAKVIRNGANGRPAISSDNDFDSPAPTAKIQRPKHKTPGRTKTYSKRGRIASPPSTVRRPPQRFKEKPDENGISERSRQLSTPKPQQSLFSAGNDAEFDMGMDIDNNTPSFHTATDEPIMEGQHEEGPFYIEDIPRRIPAQRESDANSGSNSESDVSISVRDPRERIARRMMPAAMLRRLERDAIAKEQRKAQRRSEGVRQTESPARPGRAIVRRAQGAGAVDDFVNLIASESESEHSIQAVSRSQTPPQLRQQGLVVISADESSDSSQAHEDNDHFGAQSLAKLYDGDFESLVAGKRVAPKQKGRFPGITKQRRARTPRPALGLAKIVIAPPSSRAKDMVQTRLDLPFDDRSPAPARDVKRKHESSRRNAQQAQRSIPRPAIRLEDHIIFATADFAFDDNDQSEQQPPPRKFKRTSSKVLNVINEVDSLDEGIGKARSWANFDKFSIDFGISPLPSGLYCDPQSYVGTGRLHSLIQLLSGESRPDIDVASSSACGVELRPDMAPSAIQSVLPIVFDGIKGAITAFANGAQGDVPDLSHLGFLSAYLTSRCADSNDDITLLRSQCRQSVLDISSFLDDLRNIQGSEFRGVRNFLMTMRLGVLDLSCRLSVDPDTADENGNGHFSMISRAANGLLRQLLAAGFDNAIKPLKAIIQGESDSAQINDRTTIAWIAAIHILTACNGSSTSAAPFFLESLDKAMEETFYLDQVGPIAAERVWFLIFGLCALSQFDTRGRVSMVFSPIPRWPLVRRAIGLIKISHNEEVEEKAHTAQLQGRDRYIRTMIARCVRLSAVWKWNFDRESFSVATKDLGVIFKNRQHRNLPTEPPVDFPDFIARFDMSLTAAEDTRGESAFELYLRLICVAASDIIASAESLLEAQQAEKDVQRLIMSIIPVSPVKFNRILPPTLRQLGQLINRYSTMIAACYFSPSLLPWLLANSRKWAPFENADFESRQVAIRGLMYLAVACRHHRTSLEKVVDSLASILSTLQRELDELGRPSAPVQAPSKLEIERTMILVVACIRQIILHHSFDPEMQAKPVYPDPCLLHESWTARIFSLDLANDLKCGIEVVATIQAFLDTRSGALPRLARQRREAREKRNESQDEFSFGIDFSVVDLVALGGEGSAAEDPVQLQDEQFAKIINTLISPQIYRLLSDMLPPIEDDTLSLDAKAQRQVFISKLTKCWSDCAGVIVVEQGSLDGWTPYIGPFGKESWQRFRNEQGRLQVGLNFMLNVAKLDPNSFAQHEEIFIALLFQSIVTDVLTVEHKYLSTLLSMPGVLDHALFAEVAGIEGVKYSIDRSAFMDIRGSILEAIFSVIPSILGSQYTAPSRKTLIYRCINLLVSALISNDKAIEPTKVIHKSSYHAFALHTISDLTRLAGEYITPASVPGLRSFVL